MLPYWFLVGKEPLHERLVDDGHLRGSNRVLVREVAAAHNRYTNRLQEVRAHSIPRGSALGVRSGSGMPLLNNTLTPVVALERAVHRHAEAGHAGQRGGKRARPTSWEGGGGGGGLSGRLR